MKRIVITYIPLKHFTYFQYLIFGFYQWSKKGEIEFIINPEKVYDRVFYRFYRLYRLVRKYGKHDRKQKRNNYLLRGYYQDHDVRIYFTYDIADNPHYYDLEVLKSVDLYFKAQCPIEFKETGFELTPEVVLPYSPGIFKYINKIYPSMIAPGFGVNNIFSYKQLNHGYQEMFLPEIKKAKSIMCYFGNSLGPKEFLSEEPDSYLKESHILAFFKGKISHPNVKREKAAKLISEILVDSDARVVHEGNCDTDYFEKDSKFFIPLKDFPLHISKFRYNLNISGHRLSIPFRFIHSFSVGTAIITDKLKLKWYLPFGPEVHESVEMGYLPTEQINWKEFRQDLLKLPVIDPNQVLKEFQNKWTPEAFAGYIIETCKSKIQIS